MDAITGLVGRAREREQALAAIARGANVAGASQRRHRQERLPAPSAPRVRGRGADRHLGPATSTKHVLEALCQQLHAAVGLGVPAGLLGARARAKALRTGELPWSDLAQPIRRLAVPETTRIIVAALGKRPCLVLIEALEVPPSRRSGTSR